MLRNTPLTVLTVAAPLALVMLTACGGPPPTKMVASTTEDGVPANSASEQRLASGSPPKSAPAPAADPTQPLTTPVGGDPSATGGAAGASPGAAPAGGPAAKGSGKKGDPKAPKEKEPKAAAAGATDKVSKAECKQLVDKYIDLTISTDARFEGIPADMLEQFKSQAVTQTQGQKGDPCSSQDVSRTQYNCAIASKTTQAWQRCMK